MSTIANRGWMYRMTNAEGFLCRDYCEKVKEFLEFAFSNDDFVEKRPLEGGRILRSIKCPCKRCKNTPYLEENEVLMHFLSKAFLVIQLGINMVKHTLHLYTWDKALI